jgi:cytochrome c
VKFFTVLLLLSIAAHPAAAEQEGERLFAPCRACHSLDPAEQGRPGPNLAGLIGRNIGGDTAFDYSPVLRKAREDGLRWDTQRLETFLADPEEMFPGL